MKNYTIQAFSENDMMQHRRQQRKLWLNLAASFGVLGGIYMIFFLSMEEFRAHYQFAMLPFSLPLLFFAGFTVYRHTRFIQDAREQKKICGEFPAETSASDGDKNTNYYLRVRTNRELHSIRISKKLYEQIVTGEIISIEFSMHARTIFRLSQAGREIDPNL